MTQRKNDEKPQPVLSDGLRKPTAVNLMKVNLYHYPIQI